MLQSQFSGFCRRDFATLVTFNYIGAGACDLDLPKHP
jgi:hypothetical protein